MKKIDDRFAEAGNSRIIPDVSPGVVPADYVMGTDGFIYRCRVSHVSSNNAAATSMVLGADILGNR